MSLIPEDKVREIKEQSSLHQIMGQYHDLSKKKGSQVVADCPSCGANKKLNYTEAKQITKCFSCGASAKTAESYLMNFHGKTYPETLHELAKLNLIDIEPKNPKRNKPKRNLKTITQSFRDKMLEESGLSLADVTDRVFVDENTQQEKKMYTSGTFDDRYEIVKGDDVIIHYFDLEGKPMTYYRPTRSGTPSATKLPFRRVRYQNPNLHLDKNGKPTKYKSPWKSGNHIYIPKAIRSKYKTGRKIETLYIQEGEKKADKSCKHGLFSVGIMGIHNLAYNKTLPKEFEQIIKKCQVKNVVFVLDADWQDLSSKIDSKHPADNRPKSFFRAVINYRNHFAAFANNDIYLNIFFAHVKKNERKDKGIDDLLTNTLKGQEDILAKVCDTALKAPDGNATHMQFYNITTVSEFKIRNHWGLQNKDAFFERYSNRLSQLEIPFLFGGVKYRYEKGKFELAQPIMPSEKYWVKKEKKNSDNEVISTSYEFKYEKSCVFLQNRGFYRLRQGDGSFIFIKIQNNIVNEVQPHDIKDFIREFSRSLNEPGLLELIYKGGKHYFSRDSLSNLDYKELNVHQSDRGIQYMYFKNEVWKITKEGIDTERLDHITGHVWANRIKDFEPKRELLFKELHQINDEDVKINPKLKDYVGEWTFGLTKAGEDCDFLQFLINTSDMHHKGRTRSQDQYSLEERFECTRHLLSKITAFGYLLHNYKDSSIEKAVIGMDAQMSVVGTSNGRTGKSLIGKALEKLVDVEFIAGKRKDLLDDKFIFDGVTERTNVTWIDDTRMDFDLELLFPHITGNFVAERKSLGKRNFTHSIKFYISTNHSIKGDTSSFKDRQILIGFSDWYDDKHKPKDDFKMNFWDPEWSNKQWNLFYNFAALCLSTYFKYGIIEAPQEKLEKRRDRQFLGEDFLEWADEFFSTSASFNQKLVKDNVYKFGFNGDGRKGYMQKFPTHKYVTATLFKKKLMKLCEFRGWEWNPSKRGENIKKGGVEYVEIGIPDKAYYSMLEQENTI